MKKKGFTLIELMLVVAIIGILAAIAIPSFNRFIMRSKNNEAYVAISKIQHGSIAWYHEEHTDTTGTPMLRHFPHSNSPTATAPTASSDVTNSPSMLNCGALLDQPSLYPKNSANWNSEPWMSLKFSINKAHYYRFTYTSQYTEKDAFYLITARGDLDCDGVPSIIKATGWVQANSGEVIHTEIFNNLNSGKELE